MVITNGMIGMDKTALALSEVPLGQGLNIETHQNMKTTKLA